MPRIREDVIVAAPSAGTTPTPARNQSVEFARLLALGAVIGIPAALVAALFISAVHYLEKWLWDDLPEAIGASSPPWYLVVGLPVAGAAIVALARRFLPGDGGHRPLAGLTGGNPVLAAAPGIALAAIGTLAFGAVLGPEGPLIALGSLVGLSITVFTRLETQEQRMVATAGSFAAISALFGGPVVAGVMMVEAAVGLGAMAIPALLPGFVAAAVGYVLFIGLDSWGGLATQAIVVPDLPVYGTTRIIDLVVAIVVGFVAALVIHIVRSGAAAIEQRTVPRLGMPVALLAGGALVGATALVARWLGADSQDVLFSGQSSIPAVIGERSTAILLVLLVAKALGYALSLGAGFRGGPVFPAIFLGVALASFTINWLDVSPTLALAAGAAAGMAATTRLLLTSTVFASLLVGSAGIDAAPAAVLAAVASWATVTALDRRSAAAATGDAVPAPA